MTGGSLGLRSGSYGSLQQQAQNGSLLPIQNPPLRKISKMLPSNSREKEKFLPRICKIASRRRVGMLLLLVVSVVVFTSLSSAVNKDDDTPRSDNEHSKSAQRLQTIQPNMRVLPNYIAVPIVFAGFDAKLSTATGQDKKENNTEPFILLAAPPGINKNRTLLPSTTRLYALPPGHPCEKFALPPPPADRKRIGPRPCPVCYLSVDQAIASMPAVASPSPVLRNLTYITEHTTPSAHISGGSPFGGYPSLQQRNESFNIKESMSVHCGFVKGSRPGHQTGFDIDDSDLLEMEQCHGIVVASAIFGNYDVIQQPKNISEEAKRNVCFYMFVDEETEASIKNSSAINNTMRVGLWRVVVVHNLPYTDARRNGKVPKLLLHRIFINVQYSIWIDGKLELVVDPYQILERFLWRSSATFAISRHYRRFDVFDEAEANKAAGKYSNSSIDEQIDFYKREGLTHYSSEKFPITSDVPEGCVIIREHIPITNLFTCLWFNEVDRFTSRDQLSFSTVRDKLMAKVDWNVYMFLDCERRNFVVQAYHRDLLEQRAARSPPLVMRADSAQKQVSVINREKAARTQTTTKKMPAKRGREKKPGSRRHRKTIINRDTSN